MESDLIFKTPFSLTYWRLAAKESKKLQNIVFTAILISLALVLETFGKAIPFKPFGRHINLSFLPLALISMMFGPIMGIGSGAISDTLGYFIFSEGYPFFPGYTLSAMLASLIYSLFLYRTRLSLLKIFTSRFLVNMIINALIGSFWLSIIVSSSTFYAFLVAGLLKNIIMLPFEVAIMYIMFKGLIPTFKTLDIISDKIPDKIKLI